MGPQNIMRRQPGGAEANSVGGATPDTEHLGEVFNLRCALDPSLCHAGFQLFGGDEGARLVEVLPLKQQGQFVGVLNASENPAVVLAVAGAPVKRRIKH